MRETVRPGDEGGTRRQGASSSSPAVPRTFAEKLDHLFTTVHPRSKPEYSTREVAQAISAKGGSTISAVYIWELRKGAKDNPTKKHMEALAGFFGVPSGYFMDDALAARVDKQLELAVAGRDGRLLNLALRASGLSDKSIDTILALIEHTRTLEGLESGDSD